MKSVYSTAELAAMLDVNQSTVKRWADLGHIECLKTKGGHRRFPARSVLKFVHANRLTVPELEGGPPLEGALHERVANGDLGPLRPVLKAAMLCGNATEVLKSFRLGLAARPDLLALYDELVFPPLAEIGDAWARGEITVDVEHLASQAVREAITRLQSELYLHPPHDGTALLACIEGEQHDLGLRCVNQYLTSEGWRTYFLGCQTPTDSLVFSINRHRPRLAVLSAVAIPDEAKFIHDLNEQVIPAVHRQGARLVLGGPGLRRRFEGRIDADFLSESILDMREIAHQARAASA